MTGPGVRDGALAKVTGAARYAADVPLDGVLHAVLVTSTAARGRLTRIDAARARAAPGARLVLTHAELEGALAPDGFFGAGGHFQSSLNPLASPAIAYFGQIVAVVVATTIEEAEAAAALVRAEYELLPADATLVGGLDGAKPVPGASIDVGALEAALGEASVLVADEYATAPQHHHPIEPYVTAARWLGDALEVHVPSQWVAGTRRALAMVFRIPQDRVRVLSPNVGGGFGAKATVLWHTALIAEAARRLAHPVKLTVTRPQMSTVGSFRPETLQRVRLAALTDGTLLAYEHEAWGQTSRIDTVALTGTTYAARIYAAGAIRTREHVVPTDVNTPGFMRAPQELPHAFALESAMDELALRLGLDPVRLRLVNEPERDPVSALPFSSRGLVQCLRRGAKLFGWERRTPAVGSMRDEQGDLLGWGCASAWYPVYRTPAWARVRLGADGRALVEIGAHDLGTGAATVLKQIAATALRFPLDCVDVRLGDSDLPVGPMAAGSSTTASAGSAMLVACEAALARVRELRPAQRSPEGVPGADDADDLRRVLAAVAERAPGGVIEVTGEWAPPELDRAQVLEARDGRRVRAGAVSPTHAMFSFGAQFAEVRVEAGTNRLQVSRLVGVFDCGRVINKQTTLGQLVGGMIWGIGHALMEDGTVDRRCARFVSADLGTYHIASNADVGEIVAETIELDDGEVNPLGVKGAGEVGAVGVAAAIANAIHHATGVRMRRTPMLIDQLI